MVAFLFNNLSMVMSFIASHFSFFTSHVLAFNFSITTYLYNGRKIVKFLLVGV